MFLIPSTTHNNTARRTNGNQNAFLNQNHQNHSTRLSNDHNFTLTPQGTPQGIHEDDVAMEDHSHPIDTV
jgi:hypothetical protein